MLPILISVSVAPVSYFFCASAPLEDAAIKANAVESTASFLVADIPSLPFHLTHDSVPGPLNEALLASL